MTSRGYGITSGRISTSTVYISYTCERRSEHSFCVGWPADWSVRSTFTPLIASAIFYASNGEFHINYIDALYNCVSAVTVCGLATIDLSSLTPWQQVILFFLMCLGSPVRPPALFPSH